MLLTNSLVLRNLIQPEANAPLSGASESKIQNYATRKKHECLSGLPGMQDAELHNPHQQEDHSEAGTYEVLPQL